MAAKAQARGKKKPRSAVKTAQRMSGFDFATWRTGSDDPVMRSTIMGLLVLDRAPDWKTLVERFDRSSRTNAALRQKVIDQGGLTTPRLIIDNDFDLSFHLRRFRMPEGSDWADVLEDARRQSMTDFDKDRPLWRTTVLEGLPGGRAAIIIKIHHAIADGQGAVMLGASLFDFTADGMDLGQMPEAPIGETLDRAGFVEVVIRDRFGWMARSTQDFVRGVGPLTLTALRDPSDTITRISRTAKSLARFTKVPLGPLSPLMVERSINYTFGTIDLPFADIKAAGKQANHTANDVFMAAVANGMGKYHISLGQPVKKLRVNMPVSTRTDSSGTSNAVNIARFELPISVKQTKRLMDQISETVTAIRHEPALAFANELGEISRFIPSDIVAAAAQASDVTVSNVPGVPVPVWLAGAQVEAMYPLVATIGAAVNVTMLTYNGNASIGISCDDAAVPDVDLLVSCLREGFADVLEKPVEATTPIGDVLAEKQTSDDEPRKTMSTPEKGAREMAPAKKTAAKKSAAKKTAAKKAPAKKATAKKTVAKKAPAKKAPAKKAPAKKAPAKKAPAKKAPAKKAPAKKAPAKKAPAKKAPAKKAPAKKAPAKKAPAKKAPAKKAPAKKARR